MQPAHEEAEENALFIGSITAAAVEPLGLRLADLLGDADLHHVQHRPYGHRQHELHQKEAQPLRGPRHRLADAALPLSGPTSAAIALAAAHESLAALEKGLRENDPAIPPSMIYAYAALKMGIAYANGAPNLSADVPAMVELAEQTGTPIMGKDFKTGQTLLKTVLAPGFKARQLGHNAFINRVMQQPKIWLIGQEESPQHEPTHPT